MDKDKVNQILDFLLQTLKEGKDFAMEQAPSIFQEIVLWGRCWHTFIASVCLLVAITLIVFTVIVAVKTWKHITEDTQQVFLATIPGIPAAVLLIPFFVHTYYAIMAFAAPKLYVLDCLASYLKH